VTSETSFRGMMGKLKAGDSVAAADVHHRYVDELVQLARRRLQKRYQTKFDADDIVQSAFHSFFRRHADGQFEFEDWDNLWALLASITIRKCGRRVQAFRSAKRNIQREQALAPDADMASLSVSREPTPDDAARLEETLDQLLSELTPDQQQVLVLKLQNYSNEEISERIGRTERTVYRVLTLIRRRLEEMEGELD
jgi:RNA polymerase sigma-70 factor (ECF subfamily)